MMNKTVTGRLALAGLLGALAVALGALGAHALKGQVKLGAMSQDSLSGFETGVRYHTYHVLAMLAVVLVGFHTEGKWLKFAYRFFLWGIVLFSGSLYLLCTRELTGMDWLRALGPVTPLGGVLLICGWISLCVPFFSYRRKS